VRPQERLQLFIQVCHAVHHAHQKGVIHRDIKPSNVLVMIRDGTPVPKIIDFGVAKATHQRLTEKTLFTEFGIRIGTPAYMSPEQAEMTGLDVDTATDIYSLGVLLYELLVGALPFDLQALRKARWIRSEPGAYEIVFMAMAHHRLGHREEARAALDRVRPMLSLRDADVQALLEEATALTGR
jgi:serine/threonine protein kinase